MASLLRGHSTVGIFTWRLKAPNGCPMRVELRYFIARLGHRIALLLSSTVGQDVTNAKMFIYKERGHGRHPSIEDSQKICGHVLKPLSVLKSFVSKQVGQTHQILTDAKEHVHILFAFFLFLKN